LIKKQHKIIVGLVLITLMIVSVMYWIHSMKLNVVKTEPKFYVNAENLIHDFTLGKGMADSAIVESVISVEGTIKEINTLNNRRTIFLKGNSGEAASVLCDMQTNQSNRIQQLTSGDTIHLKGVFKGFLKDVILLDCVITTKNE